MRLFTPLTLVYFLLLTVNIVARELDQDVIAYVTKPLLMPLLMLLFWLNAGGNTSTERFYLLLALFFSLGGDVFLMIPDGQLFVFGLASFLVAHICFITAYWGKAKQAHVAVGEKLLFFIPFLIYISVFLYFLYPNLVVKPQTEGLVIPVTLYATILALMSFTALLRRRAVSNQSFLLVFVGALIFVSSDSGIAITAFVKPFAYHDMFIMGTYGIAQYMIVLGVLKGAGGKIAEVVNA